MFEELGIDEIENAIDPGLKEARESNLCLGFEVAEKNLLSLYNQNKMPHALCFTGPKGIGKATFAYRLGRFLLHDASNDAGGLFGGEEDMEATSLSIPEDSTAFLQTVSGGHPDLMTIELFYDDVKNERKNAITVEEIRKLPGFMRMASAYGGWRICIIDDADTMNINAQNALLKILEEPPKKVLIILVSHRMGAFLPTIRSRVRVYNFKPLLQDHFDQLLEYIDTPVHDKHLIYGLSEGSFGQALELIEQGGLEIIDSALNCFTAEGALNHGAVLTLADSLNLKTAQKSFDFLCLFMQKMMQSMLFVKAGKHSFFEDSLLSCLKETKSVQDLIEKNELEALIKRYDLLKEHISSSIKGYLDKRYITHHIFEIIAGKNLD